MNDFEMPIKKKKSIKKIIILLIIFIGLIFTYMRFIEPKELIVKEYAITDEALPSSFHGFKIVQFSDILYGSGINNKNLPKIVQKINDLKPDVVVFTGDLLNESVVLNTEAKEFLKTELSNIKATHKKYAVMGDEDYSDKFSFLEIMEGAGFTILNNKNDLLYYKGNDPLAFIGTTSILKEEFDLNMANNIVDETENTYRIFLSHEPSVIDELKNNDKKPHIILSGHTLNGLINFPGNNYLLSQDGINNYTKDYYNESNIKMYISSGLGTIKYNVRILNPPSINLYRLYQY